MRKRDGILLALIAAWSIFLVDFAHAKDRIGINYSAIANGACADEQHSISADWSHRSAGLDIDARARTSPSAGDCRRDSLTYSLSAERRHPIFPQVEAMARFSANRTAASAAYAVVGEDGAIKRREDGRPAHTVYLPAGSNRALTGVLGASYGVFAGTRIASGVNFVPVDWSDGKSGRTVHLGIHTDFAGVKVFSGDISSSVTAELGHKNYGQVFAEWRKPVTQHWAFRLSFQHDWGLDSLKGNAPKDQEFAGLPVRLVGSAKDSASFFNAGLSLEF